MSDGRITHIKSFVHSCGDWLDSDLFNVSTKSPVEFILTLRSTETASWCRILGSRMLRLVNNISSAL